MYKFGQRSEDRLIDLHPNLVRVLRRALGYGIVDFTVLETLRSYATQLEHVRSGASQTMNSKHLMQPSGFAEAVDVAPYPVNLKNIKSFTFLAGVILAAAKEEKIALRWGGDWDRDGDLLDNPFFDGPHFELV